MLTICAQYTVILFSLFVCAFNTRYTCTGEKAYELLSGLVVQSFALYAAEK